MTAVQFSSIIPFLIWFFLGITASVNSAKLAAQDDLSANPAVEAVQIQRLTADELRTLLAPIALYPDALLAQILPASNFPLQVVDAYRFLQSTPNVFDPPSGANWDNSVIALLHYPPVLKRLNDDLNWTERLGFAVAYQMQDVTDMIQQIRTEAKAAGNPRKNLKAISEMIAMLGHAARFHRKAGGHAGMGVGS